MPITLGILAQSRQAAVQGDFVLLDQRVLTSSQANVTFSNLATSYSATYKHLQLRVVARSDQTSSFEYVNITLNGATSYWQHGLEALGSGNPTSYGGSASSMALVQVARASDTANVFGAGVIDILDAFSTSKNKTIRGLGGLAGADNNIALRSGSWASLNAIDTLVVRPFTGTNWVQHTRVSLYGVK